MTVSSLNCDQLQAHFGELLDGATSALSPYAQLQPEFNGLLNYFAMQANSRLMLVQTPAFMTLDQWAMALFPAQSKPITCLHGNERLSVDIVEPSTELKQRDIALDPHPTSQLVCAHHLSQSQLFGHYPSHLSNGSLQSAIADYQPGLLWQANHGILAISIRDLLMQPHLWLTLWQCIEQEQFDWQQVRSGSDDLSLPPTPIHVKLLLWGNSDELEQLVQDYPQLYLQATCKCELLEEAPVDKPHIEAWLAVLFAQAGVKQPTDRALLTWLLRQGTRRSEHQGYLALDFSFLIHLLRYTAALSPDHRLELSHLQDCDQQLQHSRSGEQTWSLRNYRDGHIRLDLNGLKIGQINGLSVLESPGLSYAFGEPLRITATVQPGEGDLSDVERKAELAGNIHAKSMMIIQGYLTREFARDSQFPVSGTIVFEQSYHEIDGDSASLASLVVVLSALANQPVDQSFATTGAVDQIGNVLAVGGINEKIEGFYRVCQLIDVENVHSIIMPQANLSQLNLSDEIVAAVEQKRLFIYPVQHIDEAIELLFHRPAGSPGSGEGLLGLVEYRSRALFSGEYSHRRSSLFRFFKRMVKKEA
ncbi:AAA family ATPase [Celerinatantimonas yamalensis]|uniref:endopeptidase La n=1 Tax=Celerinatantimonas yamalensis TaxID=559956 RepID=A0ABW9G300_9GAMM